MRDYPRSLPAVGHVEPAPRRVRAFLAGRAVLDTTRAHYVWESPAYPQYYVPRSDVDPALLVDEGVREQRPAGPARRHGLRVGTVVRPAAAWVHEAGALADDALGQLVRFHWAALDAWFEEDEQVFVHPRDPYTRVDALRSGRHVQVRLDGVLLAESTSPVLVFETGLPTRWYLPRTGVRFEHLVPSATVTACPYKGRTTAWWSVRTGTGHYPDLAWCYDFPTRELLPIAGLVAFYDEQVDTVVDGRLRERPVRHFS